MSKTSFFFLLTVVGLLVSLVWLARIGDVWAVAILAVIWTALMIIIGATLIILVNRQRDLRQQTDFEANMRENLVMMQAAQRVQNEQNKSLMLQLGQTAKLPNQTAPPPTIPDAWIIEDGIFDELE